MLNTPHTLCLSSLYQIILDIVDPSSVIESVASLLRMSGVIVAYQPKWEMIAHRASHLPHTLFSLSSFFVTLPNVHTISWHMQRRYRVWGLVHVSAIRISCQVTLYGFVMKIAVSIGANMSWLNGEEMEGEGRDGRGEGGREGRAGRGGEGR